MIIFKKLSSKIKNLKKANKAKKETQKTNPENSNSSEVKTESKVHPTGYTEATRIVEIDDNEDTVGMQEELAKEAPASLLLLNGPKDLVGHSWPLVNPITSIGRSQRLNDISISHNSLSKTHFQILIEKGKLYIVDLRSTNKTYINDILAEPYQKIALKNNAYIRASSLIFKFLDKGSIEFFSSMQILSKAQTDSLTGAGNRQLLKIKGSEYFFSKKTLSLIVFDIDNFKVINDSFGHMAGDYILRTLSIYVLDIIRDGDMFIRYGGDEFCIFTPNPLSIANNIADRIKQKIQTNIFVFRNQNIPLSISIGIAEKSPEDKAWEDIYHRADELSYKQKKRKKTGQS